MCGFLGERIYKSSSLTDKVLFDKILELSKQRGPDSTGYYSNNKNIQLGFNRLAVQDLTNNASQPIQSPSTQYTMVFNGEIYNHFELRKEISSYNHQFIGNGDTESLIACFDYWGVIDTVKKLNGMFSIVVYDNKNEILYLVRDHAGIKPLYYGWNGSSLIFASQYNQISRHPKFNNEQIDESILKLYFMQHHIPSPYGLLKNTYSVDPGEIVMFNSYAEKKTYRFWEFGNTSSILKNDNEILYMVEHELDFAVASELISDVPLGGFLSGGVDSPLICYFASKKSKNRFQTFTIGSDSNIHDETAKSFNYSKVLNTEHYSNLMTSLNAIESLDKSIESVGEPFGDFSIIPTWQVSKLAKEHVTVVLSGDGADELFFGYERFKSIMKNYHYWGLPYIIRYILRGMDKFFFNESFVNECLLSDSPGDAHKGLHSRLRDNLLDGISSDLLSVKIPNQYKLYDYDKPKDKNELLSYIRKAEFYGMLQKTLKKVDRASMAHGLEVRVPFLNKKFIESILEINISSHQPTQTRKKILIQLLNKLYPNISSPKQKLGFTIPLSDWIKKDFQKSRNCKKIK